MRTSFDIQRSLKRYVALALGEGLEVRLAAEQGTLGRPSALVKEAGPVEMEGPFHTTECRQPYLVHAYPLAGNEPEDAVANAAACEELLYAAFRTDAVDVGAPMRVPLYDYDGVGMGEPSDERRYPDYAAVVDLSVGRTQQPEDERRYTVSAEVRLRWHREALVPSGHRVVRELRTQIDPS